MVNAAQIQNELNRVASGQLSVFDFAEWLDQQSWRDIGRLPSEVFRLVSAIDREFAEYDHHHNETALRRRLLSLNNVVVQHFVVTAYDAQPVAQINLARLVSSSESRSVSLAA